MVRTKIVLVLACISAAFLVAKLISPSGKPLANPSASGNQARLDGVKEITFNDAPDGKIHSSNEK